MVANDPEVDVSMHSCWRRWLQPFYVLILIVFFTPLAFTQIAARTVPMNLNQLVQRSSTIVHGHIISAHIERHPQLTNLDTVVVIVRVSETLKGSPSQTFTFRQYVWDVRNRKASWGYAKGQEVVLMMNAPSQYGLSSPVGVEQGRFRVTRDKTGKAEVTNAAGNVALFRDLEAQSQKANVNLPPALVQRSRSGAAGAVGLEDFKQAIRGLAGVSK